MISGGPFQPLQFCDPVIYIHTNIFLHKFLFQERNNSKFSVGLRAQILDSEEKEISNFLINIIPAGNHVIFVIISPLKIIIMLASD